MAAAAREDVDKVSTHLAIQSPIGMQSTETDQIIFTSLQATPG